MPRKPFRCVLSNLKNQRNAYSGQMRPWVTRVEIYPCTWGSSGRYPGTRVRKAVGIDSSFSSYPIYTGNRAGVPHVHSCPYPGTCTNAAPSRFQFRGNHKTYDSFSQDGLLPQLSVYGFAVGNSLWTDYGAHKVGISSGVSIPRDRALSRVPKLEPAVLTNAHSMESQTKNSLCTLASTRAENGGGWVESEPFVRAAEGHGPGHWPARHGCSAAALSPLSLANSRSGPGQHEFQRPLIR
eukprot:561896-Rhodomonas_salina.2